MPRFFPNAKRSLDSLLILITDLVTDGLLFFRLLFRSRTALSAEVLFLRKQLAFYPERQVQPRRLNDSARFSLILWSRLCNWKEALVIVKPETLMGWQRKSFQLFWKGKSQAGRARILDNIRNFIEHPARAWTLQQHSEAIPSDHSYRFLIHDRDSIFSAEVDQQLKAFGLRVLHTPARAPKANAYCERLVGTMRRECLDFMIPLGEKHLRRILAEWVTHYNQGRPHLSLGPGIHEPAAAFLPLQGHDRHTFAQDCKVAARAVLGGLHHEYRWERIDSRRDY